MSGIGLISAAPSTQELVETALIEKEADPTKEKAGSRSEEMIRSTEDEPTEEVLVYPSTFTTSFHFDSDEMRDASELSDWLSEMRSQQGKIQEIRITGEKIVAFPRR